MNKELTPLEALHSLVEIFATKKYDEKGNLIYWENILDTLSKNSEYRIIEKSLKALEIIKKGLKDSDSDMEIEFEDSCFGDVGWITVRSSNGYWGDFYFEIYPKTQEEYDLLKEVLL